MVWSTPELREASVVALTRAGFFLATGIPQPSRKWIPRVAATPHCAYAVPS